MVYTQKQKKRPRGTFWRHVVSVLFASGISKTIVAPLERVKLLLQVQPVLKIEANQQFNSAKQAFFKIHMYQGFLSFWRGNFANVLRVLPNTAFRFAVYDKFKQYALPYPSNDATHVSQIVGRFFAGTATGMFSLFFNYPWDLVRVRMATDMSNFNQDRLYKGIFDCFRKTLRIEGIKGLYKGFLIANVGIAPYLGVSFATYDTITTLYPENYFGELGMVEKVVRSLGIGTIAGLAATTTTYPLDTLRHRMQLNGGIGTQKLYIDIRDCIQKIWKNEGFLGFYKGCGINLIKIIPAVTVQFTIYDHLKETIFE